MFCYLDLSLILGNTWLNRPNPHLDWQSGLGWCFSCLISCLRSALPPGQVKEVPEEFPDLSGVPAEYLDLKEVFNKHQVTSLSPHCAYQLYNCFLPRTTPPCGHLYSRSDLERQVMD